MTLIHKMHPSSYKLACGTKHGQNPVFDLGHGASIYWEDGVNCPDCLATKEPSPPRNHACPDCRPVSDADLKSMSEEISGLLYAYFAPQNCGQAVLKASLLQVLVVSREMNSQGLHFDFDAELATLRTLIQN